MTNKTVLYSSETKGLLSCTALERPTALVTLCCLSHSKLPPQNRNNPQETDMWIRGKMATLRRESGYYNNEWRFLTAETKQSLFHYGLFFLFCARRVHVQGVLISWRGQCFSLWKATGVYGGVQGRTMEHPVLLLGCILKKHCMSLLLPLPVLNKDNVWDRPDAKTLCVYVFIQAYTGTKHDCEGGQKRLYFGIPPLETTTNNLISSFITKTYIVAS